MQTLHFTELESLAHRDPVERGRRYLRCHDGRQGKAASNQAFASEILTLTYITHPPRDYGVQGVGFVAWHRSRLGLDEYWAQFHFASDSGLWEVPGITYKNNCNFLLDINALAKMGYLIDTTPLKGRPCDDPYQFWDEYDSI